jgi:hypothetical protein
MRILRRTYKFQLEDIMCKKTVLITFYVAIAFLVIPFISNHIKAGMSGPGGDVGDVGSIRGSGDGDYRDERTTDKLDWIEGRHDTGVSEGTELKPAEGGIGISKGDKNHPDGYKEKSKDEKTKSSEGKKDEAGSPLGKIDKVVWGPYGGLVLVELPKDAQSFEFYGKKFFYTNLRYYRQVKWQDKLYFAMVPPPYGSVFFTAPKGMSVLTVDKEKYYIHDFAFLKESYSQGKLIYEVVPAPKGAKMFLLPTDRATVTVNKEKILYYHDTFYKETKQDKKLVYVVVPEPAGLNFSTKLPPDFSLESKNGIMYFVSKNQYYLPYRQPAGQDGFIIVDKPAAQDVPTTAEPSGSITVPTGTKLNIRLASALDSKAVKKGDMFLGYLDQEVTINGKIAFPVGTIVAGKIVEVNKGDALTMELIYLKMGEKLTAVKTAALKVDKKEVDMIKATGGSSPLQALIDGSAQTAEEKGKDLVLPNQALLNFSLSSNLVI